MVRRATPTRVDYLRELSQRNVRRRTSSEEGAAMNMCSRVLIALYQVSEGVTRLGLVGLGRVMSIGLSDCAHRF